jgi:hypothetical protein
MMRTHADEGGQLSHRNGSDLLSEVERLQGLVPVYLGGTRGSPLSSNERTAATPAVGGEREALEDACMRLQSFLDTFGDVGGCETQADLNDWLAAAQPASPLPAVGGEAVAWRYQRKEEGWGDIWRCTPIPVNFETPDDWIVQPLYAAQPASPLRMNYDAEVERGARDIRELLIKALIVATGASEDAIREAPLTTAIRFRQKSNTHKIVSDITEYARDLRRNSSGADNYPWEIMKGVADYLDILIKRHAPCPASPLRDDKAGVPNNDPGRPVPKHGSGP